MRKPLTPEEISRLKWEEGERAKCRKKARFSSEAMAVDYQAHVRKKFKGPKHRAYHCNWCRYWHTAREKKR